MSGNGTKLTLARRVRTWVFVVLLLCIVLAMAGGGFYFAWLAAARGGLQERVEHSFFAFGLLFVPGSVLWKMLERRWRTGTWAVAPEERARMAASCAIRQRSVNFQGAGPYAYIAAAVRWGRVRAFDGQSSMLVRVAAWSAVGLWLVVVAVLGLSSLVCFAAAFANDNSHTATAVFLGFSVLLMIYPAFWVRRARRQRRAGGYAVRLPPVELDAMAAEWQAYDATECAKTLAQHAKEIAGLLVVLAIWYLASFRRDRVLFSLWGGWLLWRVLWLIRSRMRRSEPAVG